MIESVLEAAHEYRRRGWRVLALHGVNDLGQCSCGRAVCGSPGKHPVERRWQDTPPMSGADVQATFEDGTRNVGLATGDASGFWVLDLDTDKPGTEARFRALMTEHDVEELPPTYTVRTGGGGYQFYFAMPGFNVTNSARRLPAGVDVRGNGGQVVAPPSVSGKGQYTVARPGDILPAPGWLLELVRPLPPAAPVDLETLPKLTDLTDRERARLNSYTDRIIEAELGRLSDCMTQGWGGPGWNQTTFEVACTLIELANSPWCPADLRFVHDALLERAPRDANFGDAEIEGCFASALRTVGGKVRALPEDRGAPKQLVFEGDPLTDPRAGAADGPAAAPEPPILWPMTDLGNAHRMVDLYRDVLRYIPQAKTWSVYANGVWTMEEEAETGAAQEMMEGLVEREAAYYSDVPNGANGDQPSDREKFVKWAYAQQADARIKACISQSRGRRELRARETDFDSQPHLFNVANGVIDLRTGELLDHDPALLLSLQSGVVYDPEASAPTWEKFLDRCLPDPEVRDYLQKALGYSLTGSMAEQALFIHHGPGANGKSVFLVVASLLAGGYSQVVPRETLLAKGSTPEHPTSVARMRGKRFLQASETAAGRRLDEETVKGLTGGEQQTARFMGGNFFDFTPSGKIHLITNHRPRLTDAESIWRRLHLIAWTQTIPIEERDPRLLQSEFWRSIGEDSGVLNWAVQGAVKWYREGLRPTESMKRDLAEYRSDQDVLGEFIESRLERDPDGFAATQDIYDAYVAWCFRSGIKNPLTKPDLGRTLAERGWAAHRTPSRRGFRARLLPTNYDVTSDDTDPLVQSVYGR